MAIVTLINPRQTTSKDNKFLFNGVDVALGASPDDRRVYKFRPKNEKNADEDQSVEVSDARDIAVFLSIPEGYSVEFSEKEKGLRAQVKAEAAALIKQRQAEAEQTQRRFDNAARQRQKRSQEMKGKKAEMMTVANLEE